jgi:hypothetical protein
MKQTAVETLIEIYYGNEGQLTIKDLEQAKAMEKEQIIEAHGNKQKLSKGATNYEYTLTGEMYYNETFKSE